MKTALIAAAVGLALMAGNLAVKRTYKGLHEEPCAIAGGLFVVTGTANGFCLRGDALIHKKDWQQ